MNIKISTINAIIRTYGDYDDYIYVNRKPQSGLTPTSKIDATVFIINPYRRMLENLINKLTPIERAELKAIMWMGTKGEDSDFDTLKSHALKSSSEDDADYMISIKNLDQRLAKGLEKLLHK
jgi:hypothetical protein